MFLSSPHPSPHIILMIIKMFLILLYVFSNLTKVSGQRSYFFKKIKIKDLDGVDIFAVRAANIKLRPRMLQNPNLFQGDITGPLPEVSRFVSDVLMKLTNSQRDNHNNNNNNNNNRHQNSDQHERRNRRSRRLEWFLWTDGVIPFVLAPDAKVIDTLVYEAMREIESRSCVKFKERDVESDYIQIVRADGCYSSVGKRGGRQTVSLGRGCENYGIVLHELMHVVGFYHLHQRHDRDKFLDIHWDNINPKFINNFKLLSPNEVRVDTRFDYNSIMMYGSTSFSKDRVSVTMTPTRDGVRILDPALKNALSQIDIHSINRLYRCRNHNNNNFLDN